MIRFILFIACLLFGLSLAQAQHAVGYAHSVNEPLGGVFSNPAGIAGTRYKAAINALSGNIFITNNAVALKPFSALESKKYSVLENTDAKDMYGNVDFHLPSFIVALDATQTIGFTSRFRMVANESGMSNELFRFMAGDTTQTLNQNFNQPATFADLHTFMDFGVTYGRILFQNDEHLFKLGATAKLYLGMAAGSFRLKEATLRLADIATIDEAAGAVEAVYSDGMDAVYDGNYTQLRNDALGYGFDFGLIYEWKKQAPDDDEVTYKLRVGVSVTDLGRIKYKTAYNSAAYALRLNNVNFNNLFEMGFTSMTGYLEYMRQQGFLTEESVPITFSATLPAYLRINADYNFYKNFFMNLYMGFNLKSADSYGAAYAGMVTLSPRWEGRDISVYSPLGYFFSTGQFHWGIGINAGYFFLGSANLLTNLLSKHNTSMDIHLGIHIPITNTAPAKPKMPVVVREMPRY